MPVGLIQAFGHTAKAGANLAGALADGAVGGIHRQVITCLFLLFFSEGH